MRSRNPVPKRCLETRYRNAMSRSGLKPRSRNSFPKPGTETQSRNQVGTWSWNRVPKSGPETRSRNPVQIPVPKPGLVLNRENWTQNPLHGHKISTRYLLLLHPFISRRKKNKQGKLNTKSITWMQNLDCYKIASTFMTLQFRGKNVTFVNRDYKEGKIGHQTDYRHVPFLTYCNWL